MSNLAVNAAAQVPGADPNIDAADDFDEFSLDPAQVLDQDAHYFETDPAVSEDENEDGADADAEEEIVSGATASGSGDDQNADGENGDRTAEGANVFEIEGRERERKTTTEPRASPTR